MARKMRDSGVEWIGEVPEGWEIDKARRCFRQTNTRGNSSLVLLAATQKYGMYPQDRLEGVVKVKEDTDLQLFRTVHIDDFVISLRSFQGGFAHSKFEGVCSPAYQTFHAVRSVEPSYYSYLFKSDLFIQKINSLTVGIREGKNINYRDFSETLIPIPPLPEQRRIADYLDEKCAAIDGAVDELKRGIEDCKAWKKAIIFEAVTGKRRVGFNAEKQRGRVAERPMRDSGIPWIGEIPEGWEVMKGKYLFSARSGDAIRNEILADNGTYPVYGGGEVIGFADNWNCDANTVLIGRVGARCGCVTLLRNQAWATDNALIISTNKCVRYITYLLIGANLNQFNSSNAQPLITAGKIKNLPFPFVCDLREQQAIADYLNEKCAAIDALVAEKEELIADLEAYKKSLIFELVTGKREVA